MKHAGFREVILLAKNGVPWDIAMNWSIARRTAALAILSDEESFT